MAGLEISGVIIGVAGLFSSCVDAFAYFKAAQRANEDVDILLLKLDIEKARLLVWGDQIGLLSTTQQRPELLEERNMSLISRILGQIERLLTDSEKLRTSYGLRAEDSSSCRTVDFLSSNRLLAFRASSWPFWARDLSKRGPARSSTARGSVVTRTKWAIYEKEKFQRLVNDVKDFIDSLYTLVLVDLAAQNTVIVEDIESMSDVSHLKLVEVATEGSYTTYSNAASSVIAASEAGTVDYRTVEERLKYLEEPASPGQSAEARSEVYTLNTGLSSVITELQECRKHIVLTSECHRLHSNSPCEISRLGLQSSTYRRDKLVGDCGVSAIWEKGRYALWQQLKTLIGVKSMIQDIRGDRDDLFMKLLKEEHELLNEWQRDCLEEMLPLMKVHVYCSPCVCLIHTGLKICAKTKSPLIEITLRPDDRFVSSCCHTSDRVLGLKVLLDYVQEWEVDNDESSETFELAHFLDKFWVKRRLNHFEYEEQYTFKETSANCVIVIGEADYLAPLLKMARGRTPKAGEIWRLETHDDSADSCQQVGLFTERKRETRPEKSPVGTAPNPSYPLNTLVVVESKSLKRKRQDESDGIDEEDKVTKDT